MFGLFLCRRVDLCGELDLEIPQSIGLAGGNLKVTSLSTARLAYDLFRFVSGPLLGPAGAFERKPTVLSLSAAPKPWVSESHISITKARWCIAEASLACDSAPLLSEPLNLKQ